MRHFLAALLILFQAPCTCFPSAVEVPALGSPATKLAASTYTIPPRSVRILAGLVDPKKVDTLQGNRAANSRLRKICCWLAGSRNNGADAGVTLVLAQQKAGYGGTRRADEDKEAILRNLMILERLGCLTDDGMSKLRRGNAPTITRGPFAGEIVEVDHIIPRSVAPELDEKLFNLEFIPSSVNRRKSDSIAPRQQALAKRWASEGLLGLSTTDRVLTK